MNNQPKYKTVFHFLCKIGPWKYIVIIKGISSLSIVIFRLQVKAILFYHHNFLNLNNRQKEQVNREACLRDKSYFLITVGIFHRRKRKLSILIWIRRPRGWRMMMCWSLLLKLSTVPLLIVIPSMSLWLSMVKLLMKGLSLLRIIVYTNLFLEELGNK